jgi:hypothetical protein
MGMMSGAEGVCGNGHDDFEDSIGFLGDRVCVVMMKKVAWRSNGGRRDLGGDIGEMWMRSEVPRHRWPSQNVLKRVIFRHFCVFLQNRQSLGTF